MRHRTLASTLSPPRRITRPLIALSVSLSLIVSGWPGNTSASVHDEPTVEPPPPDERPEPQALHGGIRFYHGLCPGGYFEQDKNIILGAYRDLTDRDQNSLNGHRFRRLLSRQVFDHDLFQGAGECWRGNSHGPMRDGAAGWNYKYGAFDPGDWRGWRYWNDLLTRFGADGWPAVETSFGARAFSAPFTSEDTAAEVLYSLLNTSSPLEIACTHWGPFAIPHGHDGNDHIFLSTSLRLADHDWVMRTIAHEILHGRGHFPHTCGRPRIDSRDATNNVISWDKAAYNAPNPPEAAAFAIFGALLELRLLAWGSSRINGKIETGAAPAEYPNNYENDALVFLPGHERVRLFFREISTERCCDRVEIFDDSNTRVATLSGEHKELWTDWIAGPRLRIRFTSDYSIPTPGHPGNNPTQSYAGYRLSTYEGDGPRAEALADLYADSPQEAREAWDRLDFTFDGQGELPIPTPNYLAPFGHSIGPLDLARYVELELHGQINDQADVDTFRLWALSGEDGWTSDAGEYRVIAAVEVFDSASVHCALTRLDRATDRVGTVVAADVDGGDCLLSAAIRKTPSGSDPRNSYPQYYLTVGNDLSPAHHGSYKVNLKTVVRCDFSSDGTENRNVASAEPLSPAGGRGFSCSSDHISANSIDRAEVDGRSSCTDDSRVFSFPYEQDITRLTVSYSPRVINGQSVGDLAVDVIDNTAGYERSALTLRSFTGSEVITPVALRNALLRDRATHFVRVRPRDPAHANRFSINIEQGILVGNIRYENFDTQAYEASVTFETNIPAYTLCYGAPGELVDGTSCSGSFSKLEGSAPATRHECRYKVHPVPGTADAAIQYLVGAFLPGSFETIPNVDACAGHVPCWDHRRLSAFTAGGD